MNAALPKPSIILKTSLPGPKTMSSFLSQLQRGNTSKLWSSLQLAAGTPQSPSPLLMLPGSTPAEATSNVSRHLDCNTVCLLPSDFSDKVLILLPQPTAVLPSPVLVPAFHCSYFTPRTRLYLQELLFKKKTQKTNPNTVEQQQPPKTWTLHNPQKGVWQLQLVLTAGLQRGYLTGAT